MAVELIEAVWFSLLSSDQCCLLQGAVEPSDTKKYIYNNNNPKLGMLVPVIQPLL